MTLLEKIEAYVASQGNQVGGGSEFADLLKEIVNSIPVKIVVRIPTQSSASDISETEFLERTGGVTFEELMNADAVEVEEDGLVYTLHQVSKWSWWVNFGGKVGTDDYNQGYSLGIARRGELYTIGVDGS